MSGPLATIIAAISANVVAMLAAGGYPPLTPGVDGSTGKILVGPAIAFEQLAPPRVIFEPVGSKFGQAEYYSPSSTINSAERLVEGALRTIAAEDVAYNVRCWGAAGTSDPADDYDVTRALYHAVRASLHAVMPGAYQIEEGGKYTVGSNVISDGREFVFGVTFLTPVLATLVPYDRNVAYAPDDVVPDGSDHLLTPDGSGGSEEGCT